MTPAAPSCRLPQARPQLPPPRLMHLPALSSTMMTVQSRWLFWICCHLCRLVLDPRALGEKCHHDWQATQSPCRRLGVTLPKNAHLLAPQPWAAVPPLAPARRRRRRRAAAATPAAAARCPSCQAAAALLPAPSIQLFISGLSVCRMSITLETLHRPAIPTWHEVVLFLSVLNACDASRSGHESEDALCEAQAHAVEDILFSACTQRHFQLDPICSVRVLLV